MRTVIGIIVGYLIFALSAAALFQITHQAPHASAPTGFIIVTIVYGMFFAALGGYVAQTIGRSESNAPAAGVATLIAIGALVSLVMTWREAAHWSQWGALILMAPMGAVGGSYRRARWRQRKSHSPGGSGRKHFGDTA